jgi:lactaldehyde dehydrogenase/glycolaldehyde dehydrogenase
MRTVYELQFGEIYINRPLGESVHAHHAGFKESGIGGGHDHLNWPHLGPL